MLLVKLLQKKRRLFSGLQSGNEKLSFGIRDHRANVVPTDLHIEPLYAFPRP